MRRNKLPEPGKEHIVTFRGQVEDIEAIDRVGVLLEATTRSQAIKMGLRKLLWVLEQQSAGAEFIIRKDGKDVPVFFVHRFPDI